MEEVTRAEVRELQKQIDQLDGRIKQTQKAVGVIVTCLSHQIGAGNSAAKELNRIFEDWI